MKILLITDFSKPSICGVWNRVYNDAKYLIKESHEVHVFSSNIIKGSSDKSSYYEEFEGIKIHRFKAIKIGENTLFWKFKKELLKLNPDVIHAHNYRHPCAHLALKYAKRLNKPCYLTTHAPFVAKEIRGFFFGTLASLYDVTFSGKLNDFDKVITITKWEDPYLINLGVSMDKIVHIPNSIPNGLFIERVWRQIDIPKVLFFGRATPIKNLECLIKAITQLEDIKLTIVGPYDEDYYKNLREIIVESGSSYRIKFIGPVFDINEKIKLFNDHDIFVLPSHREAMPQSLIEAMAAGLLVISSKTDGGKELINHGETGYLFEINNSNELAELIKKFRDSDEIRKRGKEFVKQFKADILGEKLLRVYER